MPDDRRIPALLEVIMVRLFRSALLAAVLATGFSAAANAAPAGVSAPVQLAQWHDGPRHHWRDDRRGERRHWREERRHRDGACRPGRALDKAARMGIRRGDVVRVTSRTVTVAGLRRGHPVAVRFAQARGCPVLGMR